MFQRWPDRPNWSGPAVSDIIRILYTFFSFDAEGKMVRVLKASEVDIDRNKLTIDNVSSIKVARGLRFVGPLTGANHL